MKSRIEYFKLSLLHDILFHKLNMLLSIQSDKSIHKHYKNILYIASNLDESNFVKTIILVEKYIHTIDYLRAYIDRSVNEYMLIHETLRKILYDETRILEIHGALTLNSRLLNLASSLNYIIPYKPPVEKYLKIAGEVLTKPISPQADEAKILDNIEFESKVLLIPGSIYSTWVLNVLVDQLIKQGVQIAMYICSEKYEFNVYSNNYTWFFKDYLFNKNIEFKIIDCSKESLNIPSSINVCIVMNSLAILNIINNMEDYLDRSILLAFNPHYTTIQNYIYNAPIIMSVSNLRDMLLTYKHSL